MISGHSPRAAGCHSTVGWNWTNSTSRSSAPARAARARPSPVSPAGLVVVAKAWPKPPVARTTAPARTPRPAAARRQRLTSPASSPPTRPSGPVSRSTAATGSSASTVLSSGGPQGPVYLGPGGVAARVHDPVVAVTAFPVQRAAVQPGPEPGQPGDLPGRLGRQASHRAGSHRPAPGRRVSCWCHFARRPGRSRRPGRPGPAGWRPRRCFLLISRTRRPCPAAASAALIPAAPEPTMTTSASWPQRPGPVQVPGWSGRGR